jgi:hypothetical protein
MVFDDIWKAHLLALPHHPLAARSASEVVNFDHADFSKRLVFVEIDTRD